MKDIKIVQACPYCGNYLTLMSSTRIGTSHEYLVKRCLECGQYPIEEVVQIMSSSIDPLTDSEGEFPISV